MTLDRKPNLERLEYFSEDLIGWQAISSLVHEGKYLPITGAAMRPFCIAHILNDIIVNERRSILEFGSGITTVLIGRLIRKNSLQVKFRAVEHDRSWYEKLKKIVEDDDLGELVELVHAPLAECEYSIDKLEWYDVQNLDSALNDDRLDLVVIDGPPAWESPKKYARYPAVSYIRNKLQDCYAIFLDDAVREGERAIIKLWEEELGISFGFSGRSLAYATAGPAFFTEPCSYYC